MISVFGPKATRARSADWAELYVLVNRKPIKSGTIISAQSILEEPSDFDEVEDQDDIDATLDLDYDNDSEISNFAAEEKCEEILEELQERSQILGELYPFDIVQNAHSWRLEMKDPVSRDITFARICYLVCLLMTCARSELINIDKNSKVINEIGSAFQAISFLTAAEIVGGEAYWMGWPRPDQTPMLDAVRDLVSKMRLGKSRSQRPPSIPSSNAVKDGGVDIVAWRSFRDRRPTGVVLYGQVASGNDWNTKSIKGNSSKFSAFFELLPTDSPILALFMPRVANDEIAKDPSYSYEESTIHHMYRYQDDMGLIIDRLRLTELSGQFGRTFNHDKRIQKESFRLITNWSKSILKELRVS